MEQHEIETVVLPNLSLITPAQIGVFLGFR